MTCTCQDYDPLCLHNHGGVDGRGDLVCQDCGASADCPHHGASTTDFSHEIPDPEWKERFRRSLGPA